MIHPNNIHDKLHFVVKWLVVLEVRENVEISKRKIETMARNNPGAGTQSLDDVWNGDSGLARGIESIFEVSFVKLVRNPNPAICKKN